MAELNWTHEAELWLHDIHDYIATDNPQAAQQVVRSILDKAKLLTTFPELGYRYRQTDSGEIRVLLYGHYRIAYIYRQPLQRIDILGVFHGALDINRYLNGFSE